MGIGEIGLKTNAHARRGDVPDDGVGKNGEYAVKFGTERGRSGKSPEIGKAFMFNRLKHVGQGIEAIILPAVEPGILNVDRRVEVQPSEQFLGA